MAWLQFRYGVVGSTAGIGSEIVYEIVVENVCFRHVAVNNQLQVMAYAVACCIDAISIGDVRHEEWCGVDITSIGEER